MDIKWPTFIVTSAADVRVVSESNQSVVHKGSGLYYGLSWSADETYVLARSGKTRQGHPDILVLGKDLKVKSTLPGHYADGHQIHCDGETLYVTHTAKNAIEAINLKSKKAVRHNWTPHKTDKNHINSIWKDEGRGGFWVGYHNWAVKATKGTFEGSVVVRVNEGLTKIVEQYPVGHGSHNTVRVGDELYICSSGDHALIVFDLKTQKTTNQIDTGYWVRGIGITDDYIVLGATSVSGDRTGRLTGDSEVYLLDRKTLATLDRKTLVGTGSIYELRLIGCEDYAHNGIEFPGRV
jgi:hypothetical protein